MSKTNIINMREKKSIAGENFSSVLSQVVPTIKKSKRKKKTKSELATHIIFSIIFMTVAMSYVLSLLWGVIAGFKTHMELVLEPFALPSKLMFKNYLDAFTMLEVRNINMVGMILNSLWFVGLGAIFNIFAAAFMAYAVTKYKFYGRKILITINIIIMTLPIIGSLPSTFRTYSLLGMINSPLIMISFFSGFGALNLYMVAFFKNLSWTFAESAFMDGASHPRVLFQIMLPLAKGPIIALGIIQAVGLWNDYNTALVFLPNMPTLATGIYLFQVQMKYIARMDILMAATILSTLPPLILYVCFNKVILENVTLGGIKG